MYGSTTSMVEAAAAMKEAPRQRKTTLAKNANFATKDGIWEKIVQPSLEELTAVKLSGACHDAQRHGIGFLQERLRSAQHVQECGSKLGF